jgi:hypothetical protein
MQFHLISRKLPPKPQTTAQTETNLKSTPTKPSSLFSNSKENLLPLSKMVLPRKIAMPPKTQTNLRNVPTYQQVTSNFNPISSSSTKVVKKTPTPQKDALEMKSIDSTL